MDSSGSAQSLTAKIVSKYVAHHRLEAVQLSDLITTVHQAISHLGQPEKPEEVRTPAVPVRRSVQHDYVVCLDCGYRGKTLRRHISTRHRLNPDEYLRRWGLKSDHPLTAPAYSERRSTMAKALGLGRKPSIEVAPAKASIAAPASVEADSKSKVKPTPRHRTRRTAKPMAVAASEAVEAPTPARRGRPRSRPRVATQP
jgi:predicted transcriptional regulator